MGLIFRKNKRMIAQNKVREHLIEWQNKLLTEPVETLIMTEKQLREETNIRVMNNLRIGNDCTRILETTIDPDVYFGRLQLLVETIEDCVIFEKYVSFANAKPSEALEEVKRDRQQSIKQFLIRYFTAVFDKSETMKTNKGKLNQYKKFYDSLQPYYDRMSANHIEYIETKYIAYTRSLKGQE